MTEMRRIVNLFLIIPFLPRDKATELVVLIASNGTFFLVEQGEVLWSFTSGRPIYSSYHADTFGPAKYLDFFEDFIYEYSKHHGKLKKHEFSPEELIERTPYMLPDGQMTFGELRTTVHHLDEIGRVLVDPSNEAFDLDNEIGLKQHFYFLRKDYKLTSVCGYFSQLCPPGQLIWSIEFAHIESFRCERWLRLANEWDIEFHCQRILVKHIPNNLQSWDPPSLLFVNTQLTQAVPHLTLPAADKRSRNLSKDLSHYENKSKFYKVLDEFRKLVLVWHHGILALVFHVIIFYLLSLGEDLLRKRCETGLKLLFGKEKIALRMKKSGRRKLLSEEDDYHVICKGKLIVSTKVIGTCSDSIKVYEGTYDKQPVAVNRFMRDKIDLVEKEIQLLINSNHQNVVQYYEMEMDRDFAYIALELCACNLENLMHGRSNNFQNIELWKPNENNLPSIHLLNVMKDIARGLSHLHQLGIIHHDLKPENILIKKEKTLCAKLSGMGISKKLSKNKSFIMRTDFVYGTKGWQAPEVLNNGRQTRALDVFSLGCLYFYCITQAMHPYGGGDDCNERIKNNQPNLFLLVDQPEAEDLISKMLVLNPDQRPSVKQVKKHPLFWKARKRLKFRKTASDQVELASSNNAMALLIAVESCLALKRNPWNTKMDQGFVQEMCKWGVYNFTSVKDLLRIIRDALVHFRELSPRSQAILGASEEEHDAYFSSRFPQLLFKVYNVLLYSQFQGSPELDKFKWR